MGGILTGIRQDIITNNLPTKQNYDQFIEAVKTASRKTHTS